MAGTLEQTGRGGAVAARGRPGRLPVMSTTTRAGLPGRRIILVDVDGTLVTYTGVLPDSATAPWAWPWATPRSRCGPRRTW